jgi:hypothetical protein
VVQAASWVHPREKHRPDLGNIVAAGPMYAVWTPENEGKLRLVGATVIDKKSCVGQSNAIEKQIRSRLNFLEQFFTPFTELSDDPAFVGWTKDQENTVGTLRLYEQVKSIHAAASQLLETGCIALYSVVLIFERGMLDRAFPRSVWPVFTYEDATEQVSLYRLHRRKFDKQCTPESSATNFMSYARTVTSIRLNFFERLQLLLSTRGIHAVAINAQPHETLYFADTVKRMKRERESFYGGPIGITSSDELLPPFFRLFE